MNYKILTLVSFFVSISNLSYAQFSETVSSDRPGQTYSASTLGKHVFQLQTGFNYTEEKDGDVDRSNINSNTFLRLALSERFDLEALVIYRRDKARTQGETSVVAEGISATELGFKYSVLENDGWIPSMAFQGRVLSRLVNDDYKRSSPGMLMNVATRNQINNWLAYNMNVGVTFPRRGISTYLVPATFNFSASLGKRWGAFIELYGNLNDFEPGVDGGFSFFINNDFMLDLFGGVASESWFVEGGLSYRIKWRED
ncbi:transporter [Flammeovirga sp. EKP202]|uniref:transporter n=1 Tax=Flammeovirga sp. EKP202 TaxID=2770592 RepID=UPI00165FC632|nr:transporter [Flammeovirga sp. EKP202]MBD0402801.1 transporter [Flammeovirga sp. EKP202]